MKPCAVFEIAEVVPVMTNNYEDSILKGAKVSLMGQIGCHFTKLFGDHSMQYV